MIAMIFFFVKIYKVQSISMLNSIAPGDYAVIIKSNYNIKNNQIIAFKNSISSTVFIKRVVAVSSDTINFINNKFEIENEFYPLDPIAFSINSGVVDTLKNDYSSYIKYLLSMSGINLNRNKYDTTYVLVPNNYFFVIGDNSYESMDSRFWGFIHKDQVIGKLIAIF